MEICGKTWESRHKPETDWVPTFILRQTDCASMPSSHQVAPLLIQQGNAYRIQEYRFLSKHHYWEQVQDNISLQHFISEKKATCALVTPDVPIKNTTSSPSLWGVSGLLDTGLLFQSSLTLAMLLYTLLRSLHFFVHPMKEGTFKSLHLNQGRHVYFLIFTTCTVGRCNMDLSVFRIALPVDVGLCKWGTISFETF